MTPTRDPRLQLQLTNVSSIFSFLFPLSLPLPVSFSLWVPLTFSNFFFLFFFPQLFFFILSLINVKLLFLLQNLFYNYKFKLL